MQVPSSISSLGALTELHLRKAAALREHAVVLPPAMAVLSGLKALSVSTDRHSPVFASLAGLTRWLPCSCAEGLRPLWPCERLCSRRSYWGAWLWGHPCQGFMPGCHVI